MRSWGEGTIQKLPGGKFRGAIRLNGKRLFGPTVSKRSEALQALWAKLEKLQKEESQSPSLWTCVQSRIERMTSSKSYSPTTVSLWSYAAKSIANSPIAGVPINELEAVHVQAFRAGLNVSARTANNYADIILATVKEAGYPIKLQKLDTRKRQNRRLSPDQQRQILTKELPADLRVILLLGLFCGLRREEMCGLRHEDREGAGIRIKRAVVATTGQITIKLPKTKNSSGWVPLPEELRAIIGHGKGYVLGDGETPLSPRILAGKAERLAQIVGIPNLRLHDLRRTFAMSLLESGVDVKTASSILRHDAKMLLDVYAESRTDLKVNALELVAKMVADSTK